MSKQVSVSTPSRQVRVLIVDDKPQVRQELRQVLQLTGEVQVVGEASNGLEAIAEAKALHPDTVVMDLEMPVMGGLEATRQIKERALAENVIILSVHTDADIRQRARLAGADVVIGKASHFTILRSAIVAARQSIHSN